MLLCDLCIIGTIPDMKSKSLHDWSTRDDTMTMVARLTLTLKIFWCKSLLRTYSMSPLRKDETGHTYCLEYSLINSPKFSLLSHQRSPIILSTSIYVGKNQHTDLFIELSGVNNMTHFYNQSDSTKKQKKQLNSKWYAPYFSFIIYSQAKTAMQ